MLCKANVHLNDWPLDERRDVDPDDETIRGFLRIGYIVPLVLPRGKAARAEQEAQEADEAAKTSPGAVPSPPDPTTLEEPAEEAPKRQAKKR